MPSFYDLLKYAKTGIAAPDMTAFDKLKAMAMCGGGLSPYTIIGQPPISFLSDGTPLTSVTIKGNGQQNGTPSPQNIVPFDGTGERTGNLWDEDYTNISTSVVYSPVYVGAGSFTLSTSTPFDLQVANLFLLSGNVSSGSSTATNGVWRKHNVTVQSDGGYVTIAYRQYKGTTSPADCRTMLSSGQTALPYEPYGYKIPLTCAAQTTPLYLGEVSTVRRIKKLVLTGTNADGDANITPAGVIYITPISTLKNVGNAYCTHYKYVNQWQGTSMPTNSFTTLGGANKSLWFKTDYTTVADFKAYLTSEYAAGHPVTIWYVLATETTGIVNDPLYRIGDYCDELTTTTPIPTAKGSNTLTVDTTVQPSEVSITGNIKPTT